MASTEEAVKNENSSAQPNSASETSKSTQPVTANPVTSSGSAKVNRSFSCSYLASRTVLAEIYIVYETLCGIATMYMVF